VGIAARSLEANRALFKTMADNLQAVGVPRKELRIFLIAPPAGKRRVGGGLLASEVDMGFKIDV
jgi:hypothetical protein